MARNQTPTHVINFSSAVNISNSLPLRSSFGSDPCSRSTTSSRDASTFTNLSKSSRPMNTTAPSGLMAAFMRWGTKLTSTVPRSRSRLSISRCSCVLRNVADDIWRSSCVGRSLLFFRSATGLTHPPDLDWLCFNLRTIFWATGGFSSRSSFLRLSFGLGSNTRHLSSRWVRAERGPTMTSSDANLLRSAHGSV